MLRLYYSATMRAKSFTIHEKGWRKIQSSIICLHPFDLIVFEQMQRFVFSVYFSFLAFLLGREKMMWGHWWLHFHVNERP